MEHTCRRLQLAPKKSGGVGIRTLERLRDNARETHLNMVETQGVNGRIMQDSLVLERLEHLDRELHTVMADLRKREPKNKMSIDELSEKLGRERVSDEDSTELIREMREKEYDL